jgi:hypothetical protein
MLGHLYEIPVEVNAMQGYAISAALVFTACAGPILLGTTAGGLIAGAIQNRFQTASEALEPKWERLNPVAGLKRVFSGRSLVPTGVSMLKLGVVAALTYSQVKTLLADPIFYTPGQRGPLRPIHCRRRFWHHLARGDVPRGDRGPGLHLSILADQSRPHDDEGGSEGGNEKLRRQSAHESPATPPPRRQDRAPDVATTCPRPTWS